MYQIGTNVVLFVADVVATKQNKKNFSCQKRAAKKNIKCQQQQQQNKKK